jgi:hypothetical protein
MKNWVYTLLVLLLCGEALAQIVPMQLVVDSNTVLFYVYSKTPYDTALHEINQKRKAFKRAYTSAEKDSALNDSILSSAGVYFRSSLQRIAPYWFGTTWDFNGYTNTPGRGTIACGYFVSTTLKYLGVNVNRYHLAQQNPLNEAKSVACGGEVHTFTNVTPTQLLDSAFKQEGLYFVGLDNHVGYVLNYKSIVVFIHSNYIAGEGVVSEDLVASEAFKSSVYYVVPVSNNPDFIRKWILSEPVTILKN